MAFRMIFVCRLCVFLSTVLVFKFAEGQVALRFTDEKKLHTSVELTPPELAQLIKLNNDTYFKEVLDHILIPRVVGTEGHEKVKEFIGSELKSIGWDVELDSFESATPNFGSLRFTNVIARLDPSTPRYLTLACHYDSKYFKDIKFLGAVDSAVPCALLIHLAKVLTPYIRQSNSRVSLMLLFFDGEEAFENWTAQDSLYGARNLAEKWSATPFPTDDPRSTYLHRLDMLVLLDLIGTRGTTFYSFFPETQRWHKTLADIEKKLKVNELIDSKLPTHFLEKSTISFIEDDHVPFYVRDVPILHLIPLRFPNIWHTEKDNYSALHFPTIETISKVLIGFVYSYLHGSLAVQ